MVMVIAIGLSSVKSILMVLGHECEKTIDDMINEKVKACTAMWSQCPPLTVSTQSGGTLQVRSQAPEIVACPVSDGG